MSYDLYAEFHGTSTQDVDRLWNEQGLNIATQIRLLAGIASRGAKEDAVNGYRKRIRSQSAATVPELLMPRAPRLERLPLGSFFLQFEFTLAKPYLSKDDDLFYVSDSVNPVRKDKVFRLPMVAASSWKGLLRWTAMQVFLAEKKEALADDDFAKQRASLALLFGDEKGEEDPFTKEFAKYVDKLKVNASLLYRNNIKAHFLLQREGNMPHQSGRLMFYPTFFERLDFEVINPHSRKTKAGTHPIYLECVPIGAKGSFSLLYVPFDLIGRSEEVEIQRQAKEDLQTVAQAISAMMLTYGFSAKRTSGFGVAEDRIDGFVQTRAATKQAKGLGNLAQEISHADF